MLYFYFDPFAVEKKHLTDKRIGFEDKNENH